MRELVRTKVAQLVVVCALVCVIGGQWAVLQSVAWIGMAVTYSHDSTLKEGLVKTFDGHHPCKLCKVVREGKQSENKTGFLKVETKLDFWLTRASSLLDAPPSSVVLPGRPDSARLRAESPPTPPPRQA